MVIFFFCKNGHSSSHFPISASFATWLCSSFHQEVEYIFSQLGSGLFWCLSSSKSRSQEALHMSSPSLGTLPPLYEQGLVGLLEDKSPHGTELSCPRWNHPKPAMFNWMFTQPTAEHECTHESRETRRNTQPTIDLWAKIWACFFKSLSSWVVCFAMIRNWYKNYRKIKLGKMFLVRGGSQSNGWVKSVCISASWEEWGFDMLPFLSRETSTKTGWEILL